MPKGFSVALTIAVAIVLAMSHGLAEAITISSELSANMLRATDTLELRVSARWEGGEELYRFATPRPVGNEYLQLTGQSMGGSTYLEEGRFLVEKTWFYRFVCVRPGSTQVVPPVIIYTETQTELVDSVIGSPMFLAIGPPSAPPFDYTQLYRYIAGLIVAAFIVFAGVRIVQRRRQTAKARELHKTPEEEAAALLDALRPLKREDRGEQFYTDLEKIILGLWEARVKRRLAGKTPREAAEILGNCGVEEETVALVKEVLTECHNVRFGGGRVDIGAMEKSFDLVGSWVKPVAGS